MNSLFDQYLRLLKIGKQAPTFKYLTELLTAHIINIPFENISKIYYHRTMDLNYIPDFELYLNGIKKYNFGGTCYSNNYYFNKLLNHLGFNAILCGADMTNPDVHLINVVDWNSKKYLVDVGYGAPFFNPIPLYLNDDLEFKFGNEKFVIHPKNKNGYTELVQYRDNKVKHGYKVKPTQRSISEFNRIIKNSFNLGATFLNRIAATKFAVQASISIRNYSFIEMTRDTYKINKIDNNKKLVLELNKYFKIPRNIIRESINYIEPLNEN